MPNAQQSKAHSKARNKAPLRMAMLSMTLLLLVGCSTKPPVQPTVIVPFPNSLELLSPCKVVAVGELGDTYESAFYAVSSAYIATSEGVSKCNARVAAIKQQLEESRRIYDNQQK